MYMCVRLRSAMMFLYMYMHVHCMCYVLCAACYVNVHVYCIKCVVFNYQPVELGISKLEPHYECARRCGRKHKVV